MDLPAPIVAPLPWHALSATGPMPWEDLQRLADAIVQRPLYLVDLLDVYNADYFAEGQWLAYEPIYVAAVLTMVSHRAEPDVQKTIVEAAFRRFLLAGEMDEDMIVEVLAIALESMPPGVMLPVLWAHLSEMTDDHGAWFHAWSMCARAAGQEDPALRDRAVALCESLVRDAIDGRLDLDSVWSAAEALAKLLGEESRPLLEPLRELDQTREAQTILDRIGSTPAPDPFESQPDRPVRDWAQFLREQWDRYDQYEASQDPPDDVLPDRIEPTKPLVREGPKVGRNDPCPCGSGKKYKKCCGK